ncbi:hypothetical protein [Anabaena sp. YBS01]|uniref:hypothetical protein n=1 Tax=Anabaena sp. YBS01 TaxID=2490939 RepID=UPI001D172D4E|nr:hypothetical protein [Anabaena sp. YBS01]
MNQNLPRRGSFLERVHFERLEQSEQSDLSNCILTTGLSWLSTVVRQDLLCLPIGW